VYSTHSLIRMEKICQLHSEPIILHECSHFQVAVYHKQTFHTSIQNCCLQWQRIKDVKTCKTNTMTVIANFEELVTLLCTTGLNVKRNGYSGDNDAAGRVIFQSNLGK